MARLRAELRAHRGCVQAVVGFGQAVTAAAHADELEPEVFQFAQCQLYGGRRGAQFSRQRSAGTEARVREQAQQIEAE